MSFGGEIRTLSLISATLKKMRFLKTLHLKIVSLKKRNNEAINNRTLLVQQ